MTKDGFVASISRESLPHGDEVPIPTNPPFVATVSPYETEDVAVVENALNELNIASPFTANLLPGVLVAIPTLPKESMMKAVEVPKVVDVDTANTALRVDDPETPATDNWANGEVVPTPKLPMSVDVAVEVAVKVANSGVVEP